MRALRTIAITLLLMFAPQGARAQEEAVAPPTESEAIEAPVETTLRVVSDVPGAQVFVDDREPGPRGETPFEGTVDPGTHTVWIERAGYEVIEREVEVEAGAEALVEVELVRVSNGRLRVVANIEGARVVVDGLPLGSVPFEGDLAAGPHRLRVEADGMKAVEVPVTISEGRLTPVRARLLADVGRGGAYVTAVFAALFVGAGITLAVLGNDLSGTLQLERDAGRLATDDPRIDTGLIYWIAADSAFGLGFVFGCLALYYIFYDPLPPSEARVLEERDWAFAPLADPTRGLAGLAFEGSF